MDNINILEVKGLHIARHQQAVISDLSFTLVDKQTFFLQGEIGTGKSTLLLALLGFVPITSGQISWFGRQCQREADFDPLRGTVGLGFQNADDQLFGPTVLEDIAFGVLNQGYSKAEAYAKALAELERLDLVHLQNRPIHLLSGGEKKFIALAGVLAMQPKVLLLDEPSNGLDAKNREKLTALLKALPLPKLIASHDQHLCDQLADRVLYLTKNE